MNNPQEQNQHLVALLAGAPTSENIVCLHTWGDYPFQHAGQALLHGRCGGKRLAGIYEGFLRDFPIDWLQVRCESSGSDNWMPDGSPETWMPDGSPQRQNTEIFHPHKPQVFPVAGDFPDINAYFNAVPCAHITEHGDFDHVRILRNRLGAEFAIFPNIGGPTAESGNSFDEWMLAALQKPDQVKEQLLRTCRERAFPIARAAREQGADGLIFSLGYGGACDLISPELLRRICLEPWQEFFGQVKRLGLHPVGYFLGNILPYLDIIIETDVAGVMIEESKKGWRLDPVEIRKKLPGDMVLFGNLDSQLLLKGTPASITKEIQYQARARDHGPFVFINGSPICPDTPGDNLKVFIDAARCA